MDAPCSGEGMFRKDMGARADWSEEMVAGCAVRQKNIMHVAARLVRPGGFLLYSTCTFAPEEDEAVIDRLLDDFPFFEVLQLPHYPGFTSGKPGWINADPSLEGAVRLFPHQLEGEGHFACLLRRTDGEAPGKVRDARSTGMTKQARALWQGFSSEVLTLELDEDRLQISGERLYYLPEPKPDFGRLRIVHPGVWLGTLKKDRFEPAHPLALFLKPGQARNFIDLPLESRELAAYLRGESLPADSRTWLTLPAADSRAAVKTVWMESTTTAFGFRAPMWWMILSRLVSARR